MQFNCTCGEKIFVAHELKSHDDCAADPILTCARAKELLAEAEPDENGCLVTNTVLPRKVRFHGGQDRAYRFVFCIINHLAATRDQIVRHRCHNRRCVNPDHLLIGDRRDNLEDERERKANGVDFTLL